MPISCEERDRLLKDYETTHAKIATYPESTNGAPQSFADVLRTEQLQRKLHEISVALEHHNKTHACVAPEPKK
jgi:hypothetical protein